jgi:hypothetical protein
VTPRKKMVRLSVSRPLARLHCSSEHFGNHRFATTALPNGKRVSPAQVSTHKHMILGVSTMNTFLIASQIVAYGVSIVSASVNIAKFVQHRRSKPKRRFRIGRSHLTGG